MNAALGDHIATIESIDGRPVLRLIAPGGAEALQVVMLPSGPLLRLGSGLRLELAGTFAVSADSIQLHGRDQVSITAGNDVTVEAQRGTAMVRANDDVAFDGERIRMNC
jgi:hypothetical protein